MDIKKLFTNYSDLVLVIIAGAFFRFKNIVVDEFWYDEAFTGILMRLPLKEYWQIAINDPTPPLYYFAARIFTAFTGVGDFQLRLLSVLFGLATIPLVYSTARKWFGKESAVISAALIAVSPFFVGYSLEARAYSMYGFLTALCLYFLSKNRLFFFMLTACAMAITHYTTIFFIIPLIGMYFFIIYKNKFSFSKGVVRILPLIILLAGSIWYAKTMSSDFVNNEWIEEANLINMTESMGAHLFGVKVKLTGADDVNDINLGITESHISIIVYLVYLGALGYFIYKNKNRLSEEGNFLFVVAGFILPQLIIITLGWLTKYDLYVERYLFPAAVFFSLSVGYLLEKLLSFEYIIIVLLAYVFLLSQVSFENYYSGMRGIRDKYDRTSKTVVFTSPIDYVIARYYMGDNQVNVRLHDFNDPKNTYAYWQMVPESAHINNFADTVIVSPDENRLNQDEFVQIDIKDDYKIYVKKGSRYE